jgi:hypothetical protein
MIGITGISLIAGVLFSILSHPLHLSITNLEYSEANQIWEVSIKLFKDDFGDEMKRLYGINADFDKPDSKVDTLAYIDYVRDNFELRLNDKIIKVDDWSFQGKKVNFEAVWLNFSFYFDELPEKASIENTLMFRLFNDQKNLLIFTYKDIQKSFQFRHNKPKFKFDIK